MPSVTFGRHRHCDGITRRQMIRLGGTGLLGGLTLPALLDLEANAATTDPAKAKACIFLMLEGGPSHIDMWDLKPDAPAEIRGPFQPISTVVPGTQISEILPLCSQVADKFTLLRSHSHKDNAHQTGRHWVLTLCDRVAVMYLGRIVETGAMLDVLNNPQHPYTKALLSVIPVPNPRLRRKRVILQGETPNPIDLPSGCRFHPRCPVAIEVCKLGDPQLVSVGNTHQAACLLLGK